MSSSKYTSPHEALKAKDLVAFVRLAKGVQEEREMLRVNLTRGGCRCAWCEASPLERAMALAMAEQEDA